MRKLGVLGITLIGLTALVTAVNYLFFPLSALVLDSGSLPRALAFLLAALPVLAIGAMGLVMVLRRERLAEALLPDSDDILGLSPAPLLRVGILLMGLYFIIQAVPSLISTVVGPIVQTAQQNAQFGGGSGLNAASDMISSIPRALAELLSIAIGWFLIARSQLIADRLMGVETPADVPDKAPLLECPSCGAPYDPADYVGGLSEPRCTECKQPLPRA